MSTSSLDVVKRAPARLRQDPEPGSVDADHVDDYQVTGDLIRLMWDYGVGVLWDAEGPLPDETEWLVSVLGLSFRLATAIREWGIDMERADAQGYGSHASLNRRGEELFTRLRDELAGRYEVTYLRW